MEVHVHRQISAPDELAFRHDPGHVALHPVVRLYLLEMGGGEHIDLIRAVHDDPAVLSPCLHKCRAVNEDAAVREIEDIIGIALERVIPSGQPDLSACLDGGAYADLMLSSDIDLGMRSIRPEIIIYGADVSSGLRIPDILHLAAGNDMTFDLCVIFGIHRYQTVILVCGDLAGTLDAHPDIRTGIGVFCCIHVLQVDLVLCCNISASDQDFTEE